MMRAVLLFTLFFFMIFSCRKKEDVPAPDETAITQPGKKELTGPFTDQFFGNCDDIGSLGSQPLTVLPSGDLVLLTLQKQGLYNRLLICRLSGAGDGIWQRTINTSRNHSSANCFLSSSGHIIVIGSSGRVDTRQTGKVLIAKLNAETGDTIWTREYGFLENDRAVFGYEAEDGNYWVLSEYRDLSKAALIQVGPGGDSLTSVEITKAAGTYYDHAIATSDKRMLVTAKVPGDNGAGNAFLLQCTNGGSTEFSTVISVTGNKNAVTLNDICETSDGSFVVTGGYITGFTAQRSGFLVKFDRSGNLLKERFISMEIFSCAEKQADEFYLAAGENGGSKLLGFDLESLKEAAPELTIRGQTVKIIKNGMQLYRITNEHTASGSGGVRVIGYQVNF